MTINKPNSQNESAQSGPPKMGGGAFWFVIFHEDVDDRRLAIVAARAKVPRATVIGFLTVLKAHASRAADRGSVVDFDIEECALHEGLEEQTVKDLFAALKDKGLIEDGRIADWHRQPLRLDPTARKRQAEKRDRDKLAKNESRDGHVTSRDVTPIVEYIEVNHIEVNHSALNHNVLDQNASKANRSNVDSVYVEESNGRDHDGDSKEACGEKAHGAYNVIPFKRPTIPPAVEETPSEAESNSSPPGESSELTLENLETLIPQIFDLASVPVAQELVAVGGMEYLRALAKNATALPQATRYRALIGAAWFMSEDWNDAKSNPNAGLEDGRLYPADLRRRAEHKLGASCARLTDQLLVLADGDLPKALDVIEGSADMAAFKLAIENLAAIRNAA
jgi:hypothetical protein